MKKIYYLITLIFLLFITNSCSKDEEETPEPVSTDISIIISESSIFWIDENDLNQKIEDALTYNYGNANENEIEKKLTFNTDTTQVTASINFKQEYQNKYYDSNISNNSVNIELEKDIELVNDEFISASFSQADRMDLHNSLVDLDYDNYNLSSLNNMTIPITFHIHPGITVTNENIQNAISNLNSDFSETKLQFVICGINYITEGNGIINTNNESIADQEDVSNTVNIYIAKSISSPFLEFGQVLRGYTYFPYQDVDRVFIRKSRLLKNTLTHELGHYFSLYHTFENGQYNNYTPNHTNAECFWEGDGICDTPSTTSSSGSLGLGFSLCTGWNANNAIINKNFMTYTSVLCEKEFTPQQTKRIAFSARNHRDYLNCQGNTGESTINLSNDIDFPNTQINTSNTQTLTISNTGNSSFNITNITSSNNAFSILGSSSVVQPNSDVDIEIQFNPTQEQVYNGVITVDNTADNANSSNSSIQVTGVGVNNNSSNISVSGNLNFPNTEIGSTSQKTFLIENTGNQSFNVSSISFPNSVYSSNWNSGTISAGGSQNVTVTFQPTNVQSYTGNVDVNNNANGGNNTLSISGNGIDNNQNVILSYNDHLVKDGSNGGVGNSNGIAEAGEEIDLDVRLINTGNITATNVSAVLSTNDPDITITDSNEAWADIPAGATEWEDDFDFNIDPNCPTKAVTFNLQITSDQGTWNDTFTINVQGSSGGNPQVDVGNNTPRDNCSDTGSSNNYKLDLNTIYYKQNWNIDNIIGYGSDGNRGMWYRFETTNSGSYNIGVSFNGNAGFQLFSSCSSSSPIITSNSSSGTAETAQVNLSANTEYFVRFYDINDINPVNFVITIENN